MSLTGTAFLMLLVLTALGAFAATVVFVPKFAGSGARPALARAGMVLGVNVLVLLTAAVSLNDQYGFYADWTDLSGAFGGAQPSTSRHGGGTAAAAALTHVGSEPAGVPGLALPADTFQGRDSRLLRFTLTGRYSGLTGTVLVDLPRDYFSPAARTRRFPVLETFPGYPGGPYQWVDSMNIRGTLDAAAARGIIGETIVVSPEVEFPAGVDTECVNGPVGRPQVETWLSRDVPAWVLRTFRAAPDRASWATIGFSAGGWCSAMITMLHPDRYSAAVVMGGYFTPQFSWSYHPFAANSALARRYDLISLVRSSPPPVALWVETSHSDRLSYPSTSRILAAAQVPIAIDALILKHAGHRVSLWQGELPQVIHWLGTDIPGFAPVHSSGTVLAGPGATTPPGSAPTTSAGSAARTPPGLVRRTSAGSAVSAVH